MSDEKNTRVVDTINKGISVRAPDFTGIIDYTKNSYNVTQGLRHGIGPRFGISPIPGQSHTDGTETEPVGLMQAEGSGGADAERIRDRLKFFAAIPFSFKKFLDETYYGNNGARGDYKTHVLWFFSKDLNGTEVADFVTNGAVISGGSRQKYQSDIADGLMYRAEDEFLNSSTVHVDYLRQNPEDIYNIDDVYYARTAVLYVKTPPTPMKWFGGACAIEPDDTHCSQIETGIFGARISSGVKEGFVPSFVTASFNQVTKRTINIFVSYNSNAYKLFTFMYAYTYIDARPELGDPSTDANSYSPQYREINGNMEGWKNGAATDQIERDDGVTPAYSEITNVTPGTMLINDPMLKTDLSYIAFFAAIKKPMAILILDSKISNYGAIEKYVDLTGISDQVTDIATLKDGQSGVTYYKEEDRESISTIFRRWPEFIRGTALAKDSSAAYNGYTHVTLGEENTGVLRKNTTYEFTYSLFDKWLNYETNVGSPAKIQTGDDDYVALSLFRDEKDGATWLQRCPLSKSDAAGTAENFDFRVLDILDRTGSGYVRKNTPTLINSSEIRIYYREEGTFEWLPAMFIDAAKYYLYPNHHVLWACQGPIAALPGGQPGGFNDYAPVPEDQWSDVVVYRDRTFWLSSQQVVWSYRKNPFAYAGRNSVAAPTGEFRGMIVHAFPGQSGQDSRLVIFGSKETYIGRFTGDPELVPVVVSPDVIGQFPLDGSDFNVDPWTSYTSFSGRSAVVADGLLYYWGEKGIFVDAGSTLPTKISTDLEPDLHGIYDPNKIDETFAHYFDQTREVFWFYSPIDDNTKTYAVVFNTKTGEFSFVRFDFKIDSIQDVNLTNMEVDRDVNGLRTIISARKDSSETIQRGYFFDYRNKTGDIRPETEFLVKTVASPTSATRLLTLAGGFDATNLATVTAGDQLLISQCEAYSEESAAEDLVGQVTAKDATTITIKLPDDSLSFIPSATLATDKYFPIWIDRLNQFPYVLETNYWVPRGMDYWSYWEYVHMLYWINLVNTGTAPALAFQYRTPIADALVTNTVTLTNNSDGNCQIYTDLKSIKGSFEGQGLKWRLSGNHFAHEWMLQYLAADIGPNQGKDNLLHFEEE